jgi:hypothetical protein
MRRLSDQLMRWSRSYAAIGSPLAAELLTKASAAVAEGRKDAALAAELRVCAVTRKPQEPEAAAVMREAARVLSED